MATSDQNFINYFKYSLGQVGATRNIENESETYALKEDKSPYGINHERNNFFFFE
jgi:hypothetical protein